MISDTGIQIANAILFALVLVGAFYILCIIFNEFDKVHEELKECLKKLEQSK
jgi:hypothetical protein